MSIPKGLIIYKASRCAHPLPNNIKYGCYSNKVVSSPTSRETRTKPEIYFYRFQKKFTTEIEFQFDYEKDSHDKDDNEKDSHDKDDNGKDSHDEDDDEEDGDEDNDEKDSHYEDDDEADGDENNNLREINALKIFKTFKNVKKCILHWPTRKAIKNSRKFFKTLKQVQKLTIDISFNRIKSSKFFKSLLLANRLENLSFFLFSWAHNLDGFKLFMQAIKQTSKRRLWPDCKSLNLDFMNERNPKISETLQLEKLLEFMKDLKLYEDIHKCTNFHFSLPFREIPDYKQTQILTEIAQIIPSLTEIKINDFSYLPDILQIFKSHKELEGISINTENKLKKRFDVCPLSEIPTLKELTVQITRKRATFERLNHNLSCFAAQFHDMGSLEDFKFDISNLTELKSFTLKVRSEDDTGQFRASNRHWLEGIFRKIGERIKLEKLCLSFSQLDCHNFGGLLLVLGRSLKELSQLSLLSLFIEKCYSVKSEEIVAFCREICGLKKIQGLEIQVLEGDGFEQEDFDLLVELIANNFPLLSKLLLGFTEFDLSRESYDGLCRVVRRMKCLNFFKLKVSSSDIDEDAFEKTIGKNALVVELEFTESSYFDDEFIFENLMPHQ